MDDSKQQKLIPTPHDRVVRVLLGERLFAISFLKAYLPEVIAKDLDIEALSYCDTCFIRQNFEELICDILCKIPSKHDCNKFVYILIEHQSSLCAEMPLRVAQYELEVMSKLYDPKTGKYPLVYSIVLYHGRKHYSGETSLTSMIDAPKAQVQQALGEWSSFQLVDTNSINDDDLRDANCANLMLFYLKYIRSDNFLEKLRDSMPLLLDVLGQLPEYLSTKVLEHLLNYFASAAKIENLKEFFEIMSDAIDPDKKEEVFMTLAQRWMEEGREEAVRTMAGKWLEEGREEGRNESLRQVAKNMLEAGLAHEKVVELTGLELRAIQDMAQLKDQ